MRPGRWLRSARRQGTPQTREADISSNDDSGRPGTDVTGPGTDLGAPKPPRDPLTPWLAELQPEDAPTAAARLRAAEVGLGCVDPLTGAALRFLAASVSARSAVEIGTGAGVSTLWLLKGLAPDGVLTTIDRDTEHQRLAKAALADAAVPSGRVRLIAGDALTVLPKLSDAAYDLVLCDAARADAADYVVAALRLLRPGGVVAVVGALAGGKVASSSARDADTVAARELLKAVHDDPRLVPAVVPVGAGLLVAVRTRA